MHPLVQKVKKSLDSNKLIIRGDTIVIGVSGGADSIGLVSILSRLKNIYGLNLVAVYIDHGLRPSETPAERSLVESVTIRQGISFEGVKINVRAHAGERKISIEHAARDLRYLNLRRIASERGATRIAVAHTADDQAEQVLLGLLRGKGLKGLSGMRYRNGELIRPLLDIRKQQILDYLAENELSHCEDSSNSDPAYLRNRIRLKLLPFLVDNFDQGVIESLLKTASILAEEEKVLDAVTSLAISDHVLIQDTGSGPVAVMNRCELQALPTAIQRRVVEKVLWGVGGQAGYEHILQIVGFLSDGETGKELHLKKGLRLFVSKEQVRLEFPKGKGNWRGVL